MIKYYTWLILLISSCLYAKSVIDIRKLEMTPLIECNQKDKCGDKRVDDTKIMFHDPYITAIICNTKDYCNGITPAQARLEYGLNPIVICDIDKNCGNITYQDAIHHGIKPVVVCKSNGDCQGYTAVDVRKNDMKAIVFCNSNGICE
jgi:hypothetical protein